MHHRTVQGLEPARAVRFADDDLGDVVGLGKFDQVVGDPPLDAGDGEGLGAQRFGQPQRVGEPVALLVGQLQTPPGLDTDRGPGRMHAIGQPLGVAHQSYRARVFADADQDALAGGPGTCDRIRLHMVQ